MQINLNTAIAAIKSQDGIGSAEEAIRVLEGLRVEPPRSLMGDSIVVGIHGQSARPVTYKLPFRRPEWVTVTSVFQRHNFVEVDAWEFDEATGEPLWWQIQHMGHILNHEGAWETRPITKDEAELEAFKSRTLWACPEVAVLAAYKWWEGFNNSSPRT